MDLGADFHWDFWYGPSGRSENISIHELIPRILRSKAGKALSHIGIPFNVTHLKIQQDEADVKCRTPDYKDCDPYSQPCLFNIASDPCEYKNLATKHPEILNELLEKIKEMNKTAVSPLRRFSYPEASPRYWSNTWTNFRDKIAKTE